MYGNNYNIERLNRQKEEIENLIKNYQNMPMQTPINNFITSNQTQNSQKDLIEWRILNENEEVDNLYVNNKTLFISDNMMVLKGIDGKLEKWEIKKVYPIDKKDEKINALEEEIKQLKEMINNEHTKSNGTIRNGEQSKSITNGDDTKKSTKSNSNVQK